MNKNRFTVRQLTLAAAVAALYVVLSWLSNILHLTYGPVQLRFSEALTVLPFLCPVATWGLFIGCVITNILSPYGALDLIFGSLATLIAGLLTARRSNKWLAPLPPIACNFVLVGGLLAYYETGFTSAFPLAFLFNGAGVAVGEILACYGLGMVLLTVLPNRGIFPQRA